MPWMLFVVRLHPPLFLLQSFESPLFSGVFKFLILFFENFNAPAFFTVEGRFFLSHMPQD
jgi:hypothetical protein